MSYKEKQSNCSSFHAINDHNKSLDSEDPVNDSKSNSVFGKCTASNRATRNGSRCRRKSERIQVQPRQTLCVCWMRTSQTEFGQQKRSGDLLAYLSLNRLLNGALLCSRCYFVRIQSISRKFNSCVTDGPTDGRTDGRTDGSTVGRTDTPAYRDARTNLIIPNKMRNSSQPKNGIILLIKAHKTS